MTESNHPKAVGYIAKKMLDKLKCIHESNLKMKPFGHLCINGVIRAVEAMKLALRKIRMILSQRSSLGAKKGRKSVR